MIKKGGLSSDFDLKFVPPLSINEKKTIVVNEEASRRTENKWSHSVIAYVFGSRPAYHHFKAFITRTWNPASNFDIYTRNNGFFIIRFTNFSDCEKAINGGPYFINGRLIILKRWSKNINLDKDLLTTMPIWVRLPELNLRLWDKDIFSAIASIIGIPIKLDEPTAKETRLSYARILVEIRADADLPYEANITMPDGEKLIQNIEYEWVPPRCKTCSCFGHSIENCTVKKIWQEKNSVQGKTMEDMGEMQVDNNASDKKVHFEVGNNADPITASEKLNMDKSRECSPNAQENSHVDNNSGSMLDKGSSQDALFNGNVSYTLDTDNFPDETDGMILDGNSPINSILGQDRASSNPKESADSSSKINKGVDMQVIERFHLKDASSLMTDSVKMNVNVPLNIPAELPESTDISKLECHLAPKPRKSVSQQNIQKAVRLVTSTSPPTSKKKKRNKLKKMKDILGSINSDDDEDAEFRKKYISSNKEWDCLKIKNKPSYKKKSRNLEIREDEDSFSDSL